MTHLDLHAAGALAGGHCWAERRLFERLGAGAAAASSAAAVRLLDAHAQHAAWRAAQWWDRLPVLAGVDRHALVVAPPGWEAAAGRPGDGDLDDATRLAVAYRVLLPRLARAYARHLEAASPVADGPTRRTLGMVLEDLRADWSAGEYLLQDLLAGHADLAAGAAAAATDAERGFVTEAASGAATSGRPAGGVG